MYTCTRTHLPFSRNFPHNIADDDVLHVNGKYQ